jgi:hypothetical protein
MLIGGAEFEIRARRLDQLPHRRGAAAESRCGPGPAAPVGAQGIDRQRARYRYPSECRQNRGRLLHRGPRPRARSRPGRQPVQRQSDAGVDQAPAPAYPRRARQRPQGGRRRGAGVRRLPHRRNPRRPSTPQAWARRLHPSGREERERAPNRNPDRDRLRPRSAGRRQRAELGPSRHPSGAGQCLRRQIVAMVVRPAAIP